MFDRELLTELTKEQAIVLSAFTGKCFIQPFHLVIDDIQQKLQRTVSPHDFKDPAFVEMLEAAYLPEILRIVVTVPEIVIASK